jgi:hypothetical protein
MVYRIRATLLPEHIPEGGETMLVALARIAGVLNGAGLTWAVGASLMLNQYALADHPNDIDIIVRVEHAETAASLLGEMGERLPANQSSLFDTRFFRKFRVDGVGVDLMAGFRICHAEGTYEYAFDESSVSERRTINGETVPFAALEDWFVLYQLMPDKADKAARIEAHLLECGVRTVYLERALSGCLPSAVRRRIEALRPRGTST